MKNNLNILVIGSGGREHALAWKLSQSKRVNQLYVAPGNGGSANVATNIALDISNHQAVIDICREHKIDMVVIGPDDVLAAGLTDLLTQEGIAAFGPTKAAAQIEASKSYAKDIMKQAGVHTAEYKEFDDYQLALDYTHTLTPPIVIKADGLALGKGVVIASTHQEAQSALQSMMQEDAFGVSGHKVVIETFLQGTEISTHAFCDGDQYVMFPSAQDHKPIGEGDTGLNTGGMGTIAPVPLVSQQEVNVLGEKLVGPLLEQMKQQTTPYQGVLYPGLMMSDGDYHVVEYNARFGDPETQSYMRLLKTDLVDILEACIEGHLGKLAIEWSPGFACCIVLASEGYPGNYAKGKVITGINRAEQQEDIMVFHAGTKQDSDQLVTSGGRVLGVTAVADTLEAALQKAYAAADMIEFEGKQLRRDIGKRPTPEWKKQAK